MLIPESMERYSRNILLKGIGLEGQEKLLNSAVLLVGAGGLGSPAAYYLAAAGVGRIGLLDGDTVSLSNLQRQILHGTQDLGRPKAESGRDKLLGIDPRLNIEAIVGRLTKENAVDIVSGFDIVLDCTDNFNSRFILNDTCLGLNKPFVYGGVLEFTGQLMTIVPAKGPCFRCFYRDEPRADIPGTPELGILGAVAGIIGTLQACEAIKYITGIGGLLAGRLLTYDCLTASFIDVQLDRDPSCPSCGGMIF